ncbi:uncharacterized protein LOC106177852 [Lingula anatina]|uniref:Uncharacterized protein LOC106177852 n=1 Tax=Lingula anatina TaxID=7574 RepID=A0A1S3K0Q2_LINAN|nr:uncharacterized protein LOC106177852 [Lingula anatina]|eukprot:XP_013416213.1 uncharacterized protein LOC106177852 [Lingula anatina]
MLPEAMMQSEKEVSQPQVTIVTPEKQRNNTKKYVIIAAVVVIVVSISATLLAIGITQRSTVELMKVFQIAFKDGNKELKQQVEISTVDKLEALHTLPGDGKAETFVLHDYKSGKFAMKFADDGSCYLRDMSSNMAAADLSEVEREFQRAEKSGASINGETHAYFKAVHDKVDRGTLSDAILDFCDGLKIQLLQQTTKENATASTEVKSRKRRQTLPRFSAYANRVFNNLNARLGQIGGKKSGGDVDAASVGVQGGPLGGPGFGGPGPVDPGFGGPGPVGPGFGGPGPVGPGPRGPGPAVGGGPVKGPAVDPYAPKNTGGCFEQSACKVREGCVVKTERTCADYGWFFGNRGGVGRGRRLGDPKCLKWEYNDVKDCVTVRNCEEICT